MGGGGRNNKLTLTFVCLFWLVEISREVLDGTILRLLSNIIFFFGMW